MFCFCEYCFNYKINWFVHFFYVNLQCLNVLVQHGTTPDYQTNNDSSLSTKSCSCVRRGEKVKRVSRNGLIAIKNKSVSFVIIVNAYFNLKKLTTSIPSNLLQQDTNVYLDNYGK